MIFLKSLNNKKFWMATVLLYIIVIFVILYMAYNPTEYYALDMNEINEKNVNFSYVFLSNIQLISKNFIFGLVTLGIYSVFSLLQNVISLGIISNALIVNGHSAFFYKMIPHGIIEVFGIVMSVTVILYSFYKILQMIPTVVKRQSGVKENIRELGVFLLVSIMVEIVVFLVAGIVEVLVSFVKVM